MFIVGELKDHKMVNHIILGLNELGIEAHSTYHSESEVYAIYSCKDWFLLDLEKNENDFKLSILSYEKIGFMDI